ANERDRLAPIDLDRAHHASAFGGERAEVGVVARDSLNADAVELLLAVPDGRATRCRGHDRFHGGTEAADGAGFVHREHRIVARALLVFFTPDRRTALHRERVGADVA